ncbi:hypothetical protein AHAS_Ahas12G0160000 [Arachis hypogaea]
MDSSSSQFGGCGHTCVNSSNGYKGEIKRKLYPTRDGPAPPQRAGWFLCRRRGALGEETLSEVAITNGRINPFSRIIKKDCWQQAETFLWPP